MSTVWDKHVLVQVSSAVWGFQDSHITVISDGKVVHVSEALG